MNPATVNAAQAITSETKTFSFGPFGYIAVAAIVVGAAILLLSWQADLRREDTNREELGAGPYALGWVMSGAGFVTVLILGLLMLFSMSGPREKVDVDATTSLIEAEYDITAVEQADNDSDSWSTGGLSVESLCQPVSLNSPEFEGIADGQKVTFRVGVPECDNPNPEIVITETTGHAIDVDELRRHQ